MVVKVDIYSRNGCHLCDVALQTLENLQNEMKSDLPFEIVMTTIDGNQELEKLHGEFVPVIHINGKPHDFYKVDPERFKAALQQHR